MPPKKFGELFANALIGGIMKSLFLVLAMVMSSVSMANVEDCIKHVRSEWPYPSVADAAKICRGGVTESCLTYVRSEWPYPSVADASKICQGNVTASCIKYIRSEWPYPSVTDASKLCVKSTCEP